MMDGAGHGFVIAARRSVDQPGLVGGGGLADVVPQLHGGGAVAEQDAVGAVARLAQQFLRDGQLVLERRVALAKLLLQLANGEMRPHAGEDLFRLERLVDEIDGAEIQPMRLVAAPRSAPREK